LKTDTLVRVGLVGAGFYGQMLTHQIMHHTPGMELVAIANRTLQKAETAYQNTTQPVEVETAAALEKAIHEGRPAITTDATLLTEADGIDVIVDATSAIEEAAHLALKAIENGKHLILANAELDGTLGAILKTYADRAGVVYSSADGDQHGPQLELFRYVTSIGLKPLVCGNVKGLEDYYRTPTTQASFAERWRQDAHMVTSFADGTKISMEQAITANATGFRVAQRGMLGPDFDGHVDDLTRWYDPEQLESWGGIVDYVVGAKPSPGVYVIASAPDHSHVFYLDLLKMGDGPLYCFYKPYHLCYFDAPASIARAVRYGEATVAPMGGPQVEVIALAKRDLDAGESLDAIGGYTFYGQCENSDVVRAEGLLPVGLAIGCQLKNPVQKDQAIRFADVVVPEGRLSDKLYAEQQEIFT